MSPRFYTHPNPLRNTAVKGLILAEGKYRKTKSMKYKKLLYKITGIKSLYYYFQFDPSLRANDLL